jgi:uncharacterized membrane protein
MSTYQLLNLLILVVLIATALFLFVGNRRSRTESGPPANYQIFGPGVRDDDRYWLLGGFVYNNPDDPALFVINRWSAGITVNLAHPLGVRIVVGFLLALALVPILLFLTSGNACHPSTGCHPLR